MYSGTLNTEFTKGSVTFNMLYGITVQAYA